MAGGKRKLVEKESWWRKKAGGERRPAQEGQWLWRRGSLSGRSQQKFLLESGKDIHGGYMNG